MPIEPLRAPVPAQPHFATTPPPEPVSRARARAVDAPAAMLEPWSSSVLWIVIAAFVIAFVLAFGVGANDVANSFGTSVGSRVLTLRQACLLATVFEVAGAVLIGYNVSETVRKGIIDVDLFADHERELMLGSLAALAGSALWNLVATALALPISGTHTVVGATIGFSLVARGVDGIRWLTLAKIIGSWFVSPLLSGVVSVLLFLLVRAAVLRATEPVRSGLRLLPVLFGVTVLVNVFSVVHDGPRLLRLDQLPLWAAVVTALAAGLLVAALVQFLLVPRIRQQESGGATVELAAKPSPAAGHTNAAFAEDGGGTPADRVTLPDYGAAAASDQPDKQDKPDKPELQEDVPGEARLFAPLQIMTASFGSFAHGGNDVSNAVGPLIAVWLIYTEGSAAQTSETPVYVLLYGGLGIVVGLWVWGRRVMRTIGEDLTRLTPASGFAIELGAATTVLLASKVGLPISTTHCKVGSVVLVGWAGAGAGGVSWRLFGGIAAAWLVTVPFSAAASAGIMALLRAVAL
ncbi:sodium-dependent phosphate transporter 1-B-like [Pollicipes pollicipes]|uniref:sodium-dependent phosphate transporter 1-B-like n=1 Tax=Pollicipes pollicipes TaxID=41117 RepID=UPI0018856E7D|nr:sodium-dependent phosphate transporter 1-B-like [Pollicipes pollicipes]